MSLKRNIDIRFFEPLFFVLNLGKWTNVYPVFWSPKEDKVVVSKDKKTLSYFYAINIFFSIIIEGCSLIYCYVSFYVRDDLSALDSIYMLLFSCIFGFVYIIKWYVFSERESVGTMINRLIYLTYHSDEVFAPYQNEVTSGWRKKTYENIFLFIKICGIIHLAVVVFSYPAFIYAVEYEYAIGKLFKSSYRAISFLYVNVFELTVCIALLILFPILTFIMINVCLKKYWEAEYQRIWKLKLTEAQKMKLHLYWKTVLVNLSLESTQLSILLPPMLPFGEMVIITSLVSFVYFFNTVPLIILFIFMNFVLGGVLLIVFLANYGAKTIIESIEIRNMWRTNLDGNLTKYDKYVFKSLVAFRWYFGFNRSMIVTKQTALTIIHDVIISMSISLLIMLREGKMTL